jgi:hypothetical protein
MGEITYFNSPERSSEEEISQERNLISSQKDLIELFDAISGIFAILNSNRQIVYSNKGFLALLGAGSPGQVLGKRPGEAIGCIHSTEGSFGCGTTEACMVCGVTNSILESQVTGKKSINEARITAMFNNKIRSFDLNITTTPLKIDGRNFYVLTVQDISDRKRRQNLEGIFFHDILNTAGGLHNLLTILKEGSRPNETFELIGLSERASRDIVDEILLFQQIRAAESGDLQVKIESMNAQSILKASVDTISFLEVAKNKKIVYEAIYEDVELESDRMLLQRIITNMLKNSLEATIKGGIVSTWVEDRKEKVRFWVKNRIFIPQDIQLQIFQRSFSTKGTGRGLGTYSIKLLSENYLRGLVGFTSTEVNGTLFFVELYKKWPVQPGKISYRDSGPFIE